MLDHIAIIVADYPKAKEFYTKTLASIGGKMHMEFGPPVTQGNQVSGWGRDQPTFWFADCPEGTKPAPVHVAFACDTREQVDKFYEAAMAAGATDNGKPGIRAQYHENYYGAFVKDLDGHKIEAVCHHPPK